MEEYVLTQEEKSDLAYYLETYWMFEETEAIKCVENLARMYKKYPQIFTIEIQYDEEILFLDDDFNDWFFHQRRARRANMSTKRMWASYKVHMNRRSGKCTCDFCVPRG